MGQWQIVAGLAALSSSGWAIVAFVVRRIVRGELISRAVHLDRVADLKATITALEATVAEEREQKAILLGKPAS